MEQRRERPFCFSISHEAMQEKQSRNQGKKRKRQGGEGPDPSAEDSVKRERAEEQERGTEEGAAEPRKEVPEAPTSDGEVKEVEKMDVASVNS